jgi:hypothetical protein
MQNSSRSCPNGVPRLSRTPSVGLPDVSPTNASQGLIEEGFRVVGVRATDDHSPSILRFWIFCKSRLELLPFLKGLARKLAAATAS